METEQQKKGHLHPMTRVIREIREIFAELGFGIAKGPELETEFYNFDALNMPSDHPARDMQDTFWMKQKTKDNQRLLLRTQTSSVQIRYMEAHKPPFRIIVPDKVFRNEATDATHEVQFYQIEALCVDRDVSLAHLKGTLEYLFRKLLGPDIVVRFRPSFFPFTEPSVEADASCWLCKGKGCSVCKGTGWVELGGAGVVSPKVFEAVNIDSTQWRGFAFGFGIDRLVQLKYGIDDNRLLYSGDLRFVNQF